MNRLEFADRFIPAAENASAKIPSIDDVTIEIFGVNFPIGEIKVCETCQMIHIKTTSEAEMAFFLGSAL